MSMEKGGVEMNDHDPWLPLSNKFKKTIRLSKTGDKTIFVNGKPTFHSKDVSGLVYDRKPMKPSATLDYKTHMEEDAD